MKRMHSKILKNYLDNNDAILLLDVREPYEHDLYNIGGQLIPLDSLAERIGELAPDQSIIIYCINLVIWSTFNCSTIF